VANVEGTNVGKDNNEYVIARVRNFEAWARGGGLTNPSFGGV
jgi:hypothetical protein